MVFAKLCRSFCCCKSKVIRFSERWHSTLSNSTYYNNSSRGYYCLWELLVSLCVLELIWRQLPTFVAWVQKRLFPRLFLGSTFLSNLWLQWKVLACFPQGEESREAFRRNWSLSEQHERIESSITIFRFYSIQAPDSVFSHSWWLSWACIQ